MQQTETYHSSQRELLVNKSQARQCQHLITTRHTTMIVHTHQTHVLPYAWQSNKALR